jgi:hypothetical protein
MHGSAVTHAVRPHGGGRDERGVRKRRATVALVALLTVITLAGSPGIAEGAVEVNEAIPLEGIVFEDICGEDLVHTSGNLHVLISFTINDNHVSGTSHFQPQGATLVGLTSGSEYVGTGVGHQNFSESLDGGVATFTSIDQFRLIGKGQASSFLAYAVVHTTINASGEVTADVALEGEECT